MVGPEDLRDARAALEDPRPLRGLASPCEALGEGLGGMAYFSLVFCSRCLVLWFDETLPEDL